MNKEKTTKSVEQRKPVSFQLFPPLALNLWEMGELRHFQCLFCVLHTDFLNSILACEKRLVVYPKSMQGRFRQNMRMFAKQIFKAKLVHILIGLNFGKVHKNPRWFLLANSTINTPKSLCKHQLCSNSPRPDLRFIFNKCVLFLTIHIGMAYLFVPGQLVCVLSVGFIIKSGILHYTIHIF